jgi:internalin A
MNREELIKWRIKEVKEKNLTDLYLSHCDLIRIPEEVFELEHLQHLDLRNNRIVFIPKEIAKLKKLKGLYLNNNKLKELPDEITDLKNLQVLKVEGNRLKRLPNEIANLKNLHYLYLSNNRLRTLPDGLFQLISLKVLHIKNNLLEALPQDISRLNRLEILDLTDNRLTRLPGEISHLTSLQLLFLSRNQLTDLPLEMFQLTHLIRLDLNFNKLTLLPDDISLLVSLRILNLEGNRLDVLSNEIFQLESLGILNLDGNLITELPEEIFHLKNLEYLSLSRNRVRKLPPEISQLKNLVYSGINQNPLEIPPIEIAGRGIEAIRNYFRQLEAQGDDYLHEADLILLGESGAGKTTLVGKLMNLEQELNPQQRPTAGISVTPWRFPYTLKENFKVNIRDFGGLEKMRVLNRYFIPKRSLCIVVLDNREEERDFYHWYNLVAWLTLQHKPVIMVLNHKYDRQKEIPAAVLESFATIPEVYSVDLGNNSGLEELLRAVRLQLKSLSHIGKEPLPKKWVAIRHALDELKEPFIYLPQFLKICIDHGVNDKDDALRISEYLHDIGFIFHFLEDDVLRKIIILDLGWVSEAIYSIFIDVGMRQREGVITIGDLKRTWKATKFKEMRNPLLRVLFNLELCYESSESGKYIVPVLLPQKAPGVSHFQNIAHSDILQFRYKYPFLPDGLLARLIVRLHHYIYAKMQWRSGMLLQIGEAIVEILENRFQKELRIRISGTNQTETLAFLRKEFKNLHGNYHNLEPDQLIPCNCKQCVSQRNPHFFSYPMLKEYRVRGRAKIVCKESLADVVIHGLIGDLQATTNQEPQMVDRIVRVTDDLGSAIKKRSTLFVAYAHSDESWLLRLRAHLKEFEDEGFDVETWDETQLATGKKWERELPQALAETKIILLLISTDFLICDPVANNELPPLLEEAERDGAVVLPLILKPCRFLKNPHLSQFSPTNDPAAPLISLVEGNQEMVFIRLIETIDENIRDINPTLTR